MKEIAWRPNPTPNHSCHVFSSISKSMPSVSSLVVQCPSHLTGQRKPRNSALRFQANHFGRSTSAEDTT